MPGSIHEGGELGYSLAVSYGAIMDKPDLIVACIVGDGESESGPLSAYVFHFSFFFNLFPVFFFFKLTSQQRLELAQVH